MFLVDISESERALLKGAALEALRTAVKEGRQLSVESFDNIPERLGKIGACFVTLMKRGQLRGCIGTLEAYRPLLDDVIHNAYGAAMRDPRFPAVEATELDQLELSISVLTEPQEIIVESESQLLNGIVPGVDGLILQDGRYRATYLPSVWEQLKDPVNFIKELKCKAGLSADYWSDSMRFFKYQTLSIK